MTNAEIAVITAIVIAFIIFLAFTVEISLQGRIDKCNTGCEDMELEYLRSDGEGLFGSPECWCKEGKIPIQIW